MYFIFYIFISIIIFAILLFSLVKLVLEPNVENTKKLLNIAVYIIAIATLINILIAAYSFFLTKDKVALPGDRGIKGPRGVPGRKGICEDRCGQKVCYVSVTEHANKIFNYELKKIDPNVSKTEIKNQYILNKINEICTSDKYMNILTRKFKKKPNEKKLINYLKEIIAEWITLFVKYNPDNNDSVQDYLGVKFLLEKNYTPEIIDNPNYNQNIDTQPSPFRFIEKYDIYNWGSKHFYSQQKIEIESNNITFPEANPPEIYVLKTNNYETVYTSQMKKSLWNTDDCNYNQMGRDRTNPKNLKRCIYVNPNNKLKEYKQTWKTDSYQESSPLSIYNVKPYKTENNQLFYPVGSVWSGKYENDVKKSNTERLPKSKTFCGEGHGHDNRELHHSNNGPEKETILVSGDVKDPTDFELLWDSTTGCVGCQQTENNIKIFRPIPPEGYVSLGDVAAKSKAEAVNLKIKCVPEHSVTKMRMGPLVWKNDTMEYLKFSSYENYSKKKPTSSKKQISMTLWSAGSSNVFEENKNNVNFQIEDDGGYNLFRIVAGKGFKKKPELDAYKFKNKYLKRGEGKVPKNLKLKMNVNSNPIKRYDDELYFGLKPQNAVITNEQNLDTSTDKSLVDFENKPKRLYLVDDRNKRKDNKSDTYFVKTYNKSRNDFSSCLITNTDKNGNGLISVSAQCDKSNPAHTWKIQHNMGSNLTQTAKVNIQSSANFEDPQGVVGTKCLYHYFDNHGKDSYTLEDCQTDPNNFNFRYDTFVADKLPKYI